MDFAGGIVVHATAGTGTFVIALTQVKEEVFQNLSLHHTAQY